jgi:hypothetical protein
MGNRPDARQREYQPSKAACTPRFRVCGAPAAVAEAAARGLVEPERFPPVEEGGFVRLMLADDDPGLLTASEPGLPGSAHRSPFWLASGGVIIEA